MNKNLLRVFSTLVVLSLFLVGISSQAMAQTDTPEPTIPVVPTDTIIPTEIVVPTETNTLVPTVANTLVPTVANTSVPTVANTSIPDPTATTGGGGSAVSPSLGAAGYYSVLGGQTVTNTGSSSMPGSLGVSPGTAVTGGPVVGPPGTIHAGDSDAANAQIANSAAFDFLDQGCTTTYAGTKDLVGESLVAGVYCADAFRLTGVLNLSGTGVWIFKSASDLITSGSASVSGGDPCNVWWRVVSSATLGAGSSFTGNILAATSISLRTNASLNGRALAYTGQVSMQSNTITGASCLAVAPSATGTATTISGATSTVNPLTATVNSSTATALAAATNSVSGLPNSGGGPIQNETFPWPLAITASLMLIALFFGVRFYRRSTLNK